MKAGCWHDYFLLGVKKQRNPELRDALEVFKGRRALPFSAKQVDYPQIKCPKLLLRHLWRFQKRTQRTAARTVPSRPLQPP